MARFAYFGRLVREKGFDALFPFLRSLATGERNDSFIVFGSGALESIFLREIAHLPHFHDATGVPEDAIADFCASHPTGVLFFGYRSFRAISSAVSEVDATVMPSRFLETFGLSALESLSLGVPVIVPNKGGLSEFIVSSEYRISQESKLMHVLDEISGLDATVRKEHREKSLDIARKFSRHQWIESVRAILQLSVPALSSDGREDLDSPMSTAHEDASPSRILLISDFSGQLGGIETHVQTVSDTLQALGCEVRSWSKSIPSYSFLRRGFSIVYSFMNVAAFFSIRQSIREYNPDVIWCHSVLRRIGPLGLLAIIGSHAKLAMTYHDLGYFAPVAAAMEQERDIPPPSFFAFVRAEIAPWKYIPIYTIAKYCKLRILYAMLRKFDVHFVPSKFMEAPLASWLGDDKRIEVLPHFISE